MIDLSLLIICRCADFGDIDGLILIIDIGVDCNLYALVIDLFEGYKRCSGKG